MRWLLLLAVGCGGPILGNVPRANPAAVAGVAAAVAGAATLADPNGAARRQEATQTPAEKREIDQHQTVPRDVFDRLDAQPKPAKPPAQPPPPPQPQQSR